MGKKSLGSCFSKIAEQKNELKTRTLLTLKNLYTIAEQDLQADP